MAVDPRTGSVLVGAVVGRFIVGDGTKVGPPVFQPAKPHLTLRGKSFKLNIAADIKQVVPGKARMYLGLVDIAHPPNVYAVKVSSTVKPSPTTAPLLTLRGKTGLRIVTPNRQIVGKAKLTLKGKHVNRVTSMTVQPHKAKLILKGGELGRAGKAGLIPTIPVTKVLTPSAAQASGSLVPTPAYTDGLLAPTVEEFV